MTSEGCCSNKWDDCVRELLAGWNIVFVSQLVFAPSPLLIDKLELKAGHSEGEEAEDEWMMCEKMRDLSLTILSWKGSEEVKAMGNLNGNSSKFLSQVRDLCC